MIFFTRNLYQGIQPDSGRERRADREWERRVKIYRQYFSAISPMLPAPILKLCRTGLHDAVVTSLEHTPDTLTMHLDTTNALSGYRNRGVALTFTGVKRRSPIRGVVGDSWLYEEVHLTSEAAFSFQVLFEHHELEVHAQDLRIKSVRSRPPNASLQPTRSARG